jgi:LacI family transcriptional regulator
LKRQNRPMVQLLCSEQNLACPSVEPDCLAMGTRAAEHLLTLGSPSFAFYRSCKAAETQRLWEGFSSAIAAAGHKAHFIDFSTHAPGRETTIPRRKRWMWLRDQIAALPKPLALLVEDDRFANDAIEVAAMLQLRIPEDLAVLGVDDRPLILNKLPVSVSSLDSNLHGIGWEGAALLDRILNGESPPSEPVLVAPGRVVGRRSTATFVCDHPAVSAAVNFLRANYHGSIQVADIARAATLSTRSLQALFKQEVGCTISEELSRLRLAHAARLLRETDLKLESIAHESGLSNAKYLCEVFRPAFNATPSAYREAQRAARG